MENIISFINENPTVAVSIGAAFFTFLTTVFITALNYYFSHRNLQKQLSTQIRTTIEKEWMQEVRSTIADILRDLALLGLEEKINLQKPSK